MAQQVSDLRRQLTLAGRAAVSSEPHQAERHLAEALAILDESLDPQLVSKQSARVMHKRIDQAAILVRRGENNRALVALRSALDETKEAS